MARGDGVARSLHERGLVAWFGGSLRGRSAAMVGRRWSRRPPGGWGGQHRLGVVDAGEPGRDRGPAGPGGVVAGNKGRLAPGRGGPRHHPTVAVTGLAVAATAWSRAWGSGCWGPGGAGGGWDHALGCDAGGSGRGPAAAAGAAVGDPGADRGGAGAAGCDGVPAGGRGVAGGWGAACRGWRWPGRAWSPVPGAGAGEPAAPPTRGPGRRGVLGERHGRGRVGASSGSLGGVSDGDGRSGAFGPCWSQVWRVGRPGPPGFACPPRGVLANLGPGWRHGGAAYQSFPVTALGSGPKGGDEPVMADLQTVRGWPGRAIPAGRGGALGAGCGWPRSSPGEATPRPPEPTRRTAQTPPTSSDDRHRTRPRAWRLAAYAKR